MRLLIFIYVLAVLLFSGLITNAASLPQSSLVVQKVTINQQTGILKLGGSMATPCQTNPKIDIIKVDDKTRTISLQVLASNPTGVCTQQLGKQYTLAFDLKILKLTPNVEYSFNFTNYTGPRSRYVFKFINTSEYNFNQINEPIRTFSGKISGNFLTKNDQKIRIANAFIQNNEFENQSNVWVSGFILITTIIQDPFTDVDQTPVIIPISIAAIN
jgi:hypothetical protein